MTDLSDTPERTHQFLSLSIHEKLRGIFFHFACRDETVSSGLKELSMLPAVLIKPFKVPTIITRSSFI